MPVRLAFRSTKRCLATLTAATMASSLLVTAPALADDGDPSDLEEACENAPSADERFSDYNQLTGRQKVVADCLSDGYKGNARETDFVLQGSGGQVNFAQTISRAQFAAILNRVADQLGLQSFTGDEDNPTFADVRPGSFFFNEIEELFARGLTTGKGKDVDDVDGDGDTDELVFDPGGDVSYAQILTFLHRLLTDGGGIVLPQGQTHDESNLDCGFAQEFHDDLDDAGFLRTFNRPNSCSVAAIRGHVFDLIAVALDLAVELDELENPFVEELGSMQAQLDSTSLFTNESTSVTVTVLDPSGNPVVGQRVEVFAVNRESGQNGFNTDGTPTNDTFLSIDGTGRYGSGNTAAQIDGGDRATNGDGEVVVPIATGSTVKASYDVHAFIGETGDTWADVSDEEAGTVRVLAGTVNFNARPAKLVVTMNTSSTGNLPYEAGHTVTYQLLDANDDPVEVAGLTILARQERDPENVLLMSSLATNGQGLATWTRNSTVDGSVPVDPDPDETGDESVDTFTGTWDEDRDGVANDSVTTTESGEVTFLDLSADTVGRATLALVGGNSNVPDQMGALMSSAGGTDAEVNVTVVNPYGQPIAGKAVRFVRTSILVNNNDTVTNGNGIAKYRYSRDATRNDQISAIVENDGNAGFNLATDFSATRSGTSDTNVRIQWVDGPPGATTTYGTLASQTLVGYTDAFLFLDDASTGPDLVRLPYTNGVYEVDGQTVSLGVFRATIVADADQNDDFDITYSVPGTPSFSITTVADSTLNGMPV